MYLMVALRKESVDRNETTEYDKKAALEVALRKESVDRNPPCQWRGGHRQPSLSARRAWIEIKTGKTHRIYLPGRSPQGERG